MVTQFSDSVSLEITNDVFIAEDGLSITRPANTANTDYVFVIVAARSTTGVQQDAPDLSISGFTRWFYSSSAGSNSTSWSVVFYKRIDDVSQEPASYTLEAATGTSGSDSTWHLAGVASRVLDANQTDPIAAGMTDASNSDTLVTFPSITIPDAGALYVPLSYNRRDETLTWNDNILELYQAVGGDGGVNDVSFAVGYIEDEPSGDTPERTASWSTDRVIESQVFAIAPPPPQVPGLRRTLRDTDSGSLEADLSNLEVAVRTGPRAATTLTDTASGTTDASGVLQVSDDGAGWSVTSITGEDVGSTDTNGDLSVTLDKDQAQANSVTFSGSTETIVDDGDGNLHLDGDDTATRGTIDYAAGTAEITGSADTEAEFTADYDHRRDEVFLTVTTQDGETVTAGWLSVVEDAGDTESSLRGEA